MFEWYRRYVGIRFVTSICFLILVSVVMSCQELKYATVSKRTTATVFKVYEETQTARERAARGGEKVFVSMYRWKDPSQVTEESDGDRSDGDRSDGIRELGGSSFKPGDQLEIDYLRDTSRRAGEIQWRWPGILVGLFVFGIIATTPIWWEAFELHEKFGRGKSSRLSRR